MDKERYFQELFSQLDNVSSHKEAVEIARALVESFPEKDDSWHSLYWNIGLMLSEIVENGKPISEQQEKLIDEMRDAWQRYMEFCPKDYNTCWNMAGFLKELEHYTEAADIFIRAAELEEEYGANEEDQMQDIGFDYYHAADCYLLNGDYTAALTMIDKAISAYECSYFWDLKAEILESTGNTQDAEVASSRADTLAMEEEAEERRWNAEHRL